MILVCKQSRYDIHRGTVEKETARSVWAAHQQDPQTVSGGAAHR